MEGTKRKPGSMPFRKMDMSIVSFVLLCWGSVVFLSYMITDFCHIGDERLSKELIMTAEAALLVFLVFVPQLVGKIFKIEVPIYLEISYVCFVFSTLLCGAIFNFYGRIFWWDSLLHFLSGFPLGSLAYCIANTFNRYSEESERKINPFFLAIFAVSFSVACGVLWEFVEYSVDGICGTNMQSYLVSGSMLSKGESLVGHAAITDTIKDLFLGFCGSIALSTIATIQLIKGKNGLAYSYFKKRQ